MLLLLLLFLATKIAAQRHKKACYYLKLLCYGQEGVKVVLVHVDLPVVHKVEHVSQFLGGDPAQVDDWVRQAAQGRGGARLSCKHVAEEGRAGGEDDPVKRARDLLVK